MDLCKDILVELLSHEEVQISIPSLEKSWPEIIEGICYQTLSKIWQILHDDDLDDQACFLRIEAILCEFESIGSSGGCRHDFG